MVQMFVVRLLDDICANWQDCSLHESLSHARKCKGHVARMGTDVASFSLLGVDWCNIIFQCQNLQTKIVSV